MASYLKWWRIGSLAIWVVLVFLMCGGCGISNQSARLIEPVQRNAADQTFPIHATAMAQSPWTVAIDLWDVDRGPDSTALTAVPTASR